MYGIPESYYYLANMFKWLCQNIIPLSKEQIEKVHAERREKIVKLWLKNLENVSEVVSDELQEDKPIWFIKPTAANADVDDIMDEIWWDEEVNDNE
jgi:hypothetical protein